MTTLAIEFSSARRSVAVAVSAGGGPPVIAGHAVEAAGRHIHAVALVETALRNAGVCRESVGAIAVGLGPGSLTGIRAAIALAQGWMFARGVRVAGVRSDASLAAQAHARGLRGRVGIVLEPHRGEWPVAEYELTPGSWREVEALRLMDQTALGQLAAAGVALAGPGASVVAGGCVVHPDAADIARISAAGDLDGDVSALEPVCLRPTDFVKAPPTRVLPG